MQIVCIYSDCGEACKMPHGSYEKILKHQIQCRACDDCEYYCPIEGCDCGQYYRRGDHLDKHIAEVKQKKDEEKLRIAKEKEQAEAEAKAREEEERKKKIEEEEKEDDDVLIAPNMPHQPEQPPANAPPIAQPA